jgi:hypothetical protein
MIPQFRDDKQLAPKLPENSPAAGSRFPFDQSKSVEFSLAEPPTEARK